ncbi:MAG TPA: hypothetical protein VHK63_05505 [Candidatus Limnocylindria bacterium]|nr:hypothetical protein [Candidatus Limnocylindria bacterium]
MIGLGILLVILGLGSFVLPMFDLQFTLMSFLEDWQPWAGIAVAAIGVALIAWGMQTRRQTH